MRSLLLVSVADDALLEAALALEADALVLDLAGCDATGAGREAARGMVLDVLRATQWSAHRPHLYVRLGGLEQPGFDEDLAVLAPGEPDGILLSGAGTGADVQHLGAKLAVQEAEHGLADGEIGIIAEVAGQARGLFGLGSYAGASSRLVGLTWHAEALAADLGSDPDAWRHASFAPFQTVRHLTLFAARGAGVAAIDTGSGARDEEAFADECRLARQHGFNAKLALHPAQVAIINTAFGHEA